MNVIEGSAGREDTVVDLFGETFAASEGAAEGAMVRGLAQDLLATTPPPDLRVFLAQDQDVIIGAVMFSRLSYPEDARTVFLLSPMAVASDRQGEGIGQRLITEALQRLRADGIDIVLTYGDPNYYGKVGFAQIGPERAEPPLPLRFAHGWLGQALARGANAEDFSLKGPSRCVEALDRPDIW